MPKTETAALDLTSFVQEPAAAPAAPAAPAGPADPADPSGHAPRFSAMSSALVGSEILRIASELRALKAGGRQICDLTVGDFNPRYFPIPAALSAAVRAALERGETNYPPANGMPELRQAVGRFYARELGLGYPQGSILIVSGARPAVYCTFRTLCDPGDRVVYPVPSWNNNHYAHLVGAVGVPVPCGPEHRFMPTAGALREALAGARLLCLNSPLNPSGTAIGRDDLAGICETILAENDLRQRRGERPLYLMYDHIYWMLRFGDTQHFTPPELLPEMARYTILIDGISKAFAATGLRVGWAVGPADVIGRMSALVGHIGAWAPRAEQVATAAYLEDEHAIRSYQEGFKHNLESRLILLHRGLQELKAEGLAVDSIPPIGAIYLTARLHPFGRHTPQGALLATNDDVRRYVLEAAAIGMVPFQAFGAPADDGWFRLSAGAVSEPDIAAALPRLAAALRALR